MYRTIKHGNKQMIAPWSFKSFSTSSADKSSCSPKRSCLIFTASMSLSISSTTQEAPTIKSLQLHNLEGNRPDMYSLRAHSTKANFCSYMSSNSTMLMPCKCRKTTNWKHICVPAQKKAHLASIWATNIKNCWNFVLVNFNNSWSNSGFSWAKSLCQLRGSLCHLRASPCLVRVGYFLRVWVCLFGNQDSCTTN